MNMLIDVRDRCRKATGLALNILSGGNSSSLPLLAGGGMPKEINHFRIGEAIILGRNVLDRSAWPGTRQDTIRIVAEIIELNRNPPSRLGSVGRTLLAASPNLSIAASANAPFAALAVRIL